MRSSPGTWVQGDDFFGREAELELLTERVADGNHVLLTGQRRMGKTSLARELGRRLKQEGWLFFHVDLEEAVDPQDVVALLAQQLHPVQSLTTRFATTMGRLVRNVEEVSAYKFRLRIRAELDAANWRRHGEALFEACVTEPKPVLIVLDELPIFLLTLYRHGNLQAVDEFLTWLRAMQQNVARRDLVFIASGSIGLVPLVTRLGIPDRINHLAPFHLQPWDRQACIDCFTRLADAYDLPLESGVAEAVYDKLGLGIPHHVQSFFVHLCDDAKIRGLPELQLAAVDRVYRGTLLGPWGQTDLMHYDTRLKDALADRHGLALDLLTEAATQRVLTPTARDRFEAYVAALEDSTRGSVAEILDVLVHDGYLVANDHGHTFQSHLLRDWWLARFGHGYEPIEQRTPSNRGERS